MFNNTNARYGERTRLLILDVTQAWPELEHLAGRQQRIALLGVVVIEELEARELDRVVHDEVADLLTLRDLAEGALARVRREVAR